jgi:hypothetical protein
MNQLVLANALVITEAFKDADDWAVSHAAETFWQGVNVED